MKGILMRVNEYNQTMRISEIGMFPEDLENPRGNWSVRIIWKYYRSATNQWEYDRSEVIPMFDAISKGIITEEEFNTIYTLLAKVADTYHTAI
jgi:uncharacterized Fe-S cluster-containing protein